MCNFNKKKPIIVFGAGSIGERHIRNLWSLGFKNIFVFRKRNLPFKDIGNAEIKIIKSWNEIKLIKPFAAIICTPTSLHFSQALACVQLGIHCLVEKPLSHNTDKFSELVKLINTNKVFVYVGYMMRFHPLIRKIDEIIKSKKYGNIISIQSKWGEYLPDWHPWEDYRESYAAKSELGGGAALTLSHDIDLVNFLSKSKIKKVFKIKNYKSKLDLDVEAGIDILIEFQNKITANIHLNFYEKTKERFLKIIFDEASVKFNYYDSKLTIYKSNHKDEIIFLKDFDRNDLFIEQTKFFFKTINDFSILDSIDQINFSEKTINICNNE